MNRALLVGINEYTIQPLQGCINDVNDMAEFLIENCNFIMDEIRLLTNERATTAAILERLGWLLTGLQQNDRVLFYYSGHGARLPSRNPQGEVDGLDEAICPIDFDWTDNHAIRDKDFYRIFSAIPYGVEFIWISDSCNSGDLTKSMVKKTQLSKTITPPADIQWRIRTALSKGIKPMGMQKAAVELNLAFISACESWQDSRVDIFNGKYNGVLTYYLLGQLLKSETATYSLHTLVGNINNILNASGYDQNPQLEGNESIKSKPFLVAL